MNMMKFLEKELVSGFYDLFCSNCVCTVLIGSSESTVYPLLDNESTTQNYGRFIDVMVFIAELVSGCLEILGNEAGLLCG